ncbi:anti-sigma factor family protein [Streptomyces pinistramenti]|uniref:anti-sigma factor family protein n=1 Tax=Streptomyces pinistramenti TaxID=2884812 RepID=UPI001D05D20D|nr:anti-sigma factor [Streptomyces pinistramenti]MCB5909413.1 zf-HC2 domain-containing protein [Streptomyces pinistramenti]
MTSTTGTDEHPEVAEISDLTDGLLSPSRTAELREHLATCALCEDVHASLEEIRGLLGELPGPVRMPADIAGRIDAALAAEALLDATSPAVKPNVSRETAEGSDTVSRETATGTSLAGGPSRPAGHPRGSSGPGRRTAGGRSPRARRWPRILLGTAAAAAVFGVGGLLIQNATDNAGHDGGRDRPTTAAEGSTGGHPGLTSATLGTQVRDLLASKGSQKSPEVGTRSEPETPMRGSASTVPSCVSRGIGRPEAPIASRQSRYQGKDAYLVVLPDPSDPKRVTAYVVDSSCVSAAPPSPGKVLLIHSYPRD